VQVIATLSGIEAAGDLKGHTEPKEAPRDAAGLPVVKKSSLEK
jgi:hypothetical protein